MKHYTTSTKTNSGSGYDSEYESDGGTKYSPVKFLGKGAFAKARLFKSASKKTVAVLNPVTKPGDIEEARIKEKFFARLYPYEEDSYLFLMEKDYRLIVPYIPYVPYSKLIGFTEEFQRTLFCSAIEALK